MNPGHEVVEVTDDVVRAYFNCPRKSYLLMFERGWSKPSEYNHILENRRERIRANYLAEHAHQRSTVTAMSAATTDSSIGWEPTSDRKVSAGALSTSVDFFRRTQRTSDSGDICYDPIAFADSYILRDEYKMEVAFAAHVLSQVPGSSSLRGKVILLNQIEKIVRLPPSIEKALPVLEILKDWATARPEPPVVHLNIHCPYCCFQHICKPIAEKEDHLTLLRSIGEKELRKYEKKGIFTVKQLSFLYRPRKRNRRLKPRAAVHKFELQALALRTGNIYLDGVQKELPRTETEIFFDIEALPEKSFHYLIGIVVCGPGTVKSHQLWADSEIDEEQVWHTFIQVISEYPTSPLFHYGSFERHAIQKLGKLYDTPVGQILERLFNVNTCIFGRIYFPVRSNSLKDICHFMGSTWSSPVASGLQSIAWRYRYDETGDQSYRQLLLTYNNEDCENLRQLTSRLRDISANGTHLSDVRFSEIEGGSLTENASSIIERFKGLLRSAHGAYEQKKIRLKKTQRDARGLNNNHRNQYGKSANSKVNREVNVRRGRICPLHPGKALRPIETQATITIIDLVFTARGVKKIVTRYLGKKGYCSTCNMFFNPPAIRKFRRGQRYGRSLQAWATYHRMALRLPFDKISQLLEDTFGERIAAGGIYNLVVQLSHYYVHTEKLLLKRILASPVIYADETLINIQGNSEYIWVITDGTHVIFRQTESREASIIHELLDGYSGVLCTDFYTGYDSVECRQQKCWSHLIRDLNDDLRKSPFDMEFEAFVSSVRDLVVPIFEAIDKYGSKVRHLRKFQKNVDQFYDDHILGRTYHSDATVSYQRRLQKYREKLFIFLSKDDVPWNNNMAERALRHLAVQRKISGSFGRDGILNYLLLLGITQTCRFQKKSFLRFLLSGERDVDLFRDRRSFAGWPTH